MTIDDLTDEGFACAGCRGRPFPLPFTMAFQPIVRLSTRSVAAHEALVRGPGGELAHAVLGALSPETACAFDQASRVRAVSLAAALGLAEDLTINILASSVADPEASLGPMLEAAARHGISPGRLVLELVEDSRVFDQGFMRRLLDACRAAGVRVAVDNFGAGYLGLGALFSLGPDMVKLDMKLVRGIERDTLKRARTAGIIAQCLSAGLEVTAEGVETEAELAVLAGEGIDLVQGYLLARPAFQRLVPIGEIRLPGLAPAPAPEPAQAA